MNRPGDAAAALRLPSPLWFFVLRERDRKRKRERRREREREIKRDSSERRCNGLAMDGDGAIGVNWRASGFAQKILSWLIACVLILYYLPTVLKFYLLQYYLSLFSLWLQMNEIDSRTTRKRYVRFGMTSFGGLLENNRRKLYSCLSMYDGSVNIVSCMLEYSQDTIFRDFGALHQGVHWSV